MTEFGMPVAALREHTFVSRKDDPDGVASLIGYVTAMGLLYQTRPVETAVAEVRVFYPAVTSRYQPPPDVLEIVQEQLLRCADLVGMSWCDSESIPVPEGEQLAGYLDAELRTPVEAIEMVPQVALDDCCRLTGKTLAEQIVPSVADVAALAAAGLILAELKEDQPDTPGVAELVDRFLDTEFPNLMPGEQLESTIIRELENTYSQAAYAALSREQRPFSHGPARRRGNYLTGMIRLDYTHTVYPSSVGLLNAVLRWRHREEDPLAEVDLGEYDRSRRTLPHMTMLDTAWEHTPERRDAYRRMRQRYLASRQSPAPERPDEGSDENGNPTT